MYSKCLNNINLVYLLICWYFKTIIREWIQIQNKKGIYSKANKLIFFYKIISEYAKSTPAPSQILFIYLLSSHSIVSQNYNWQSQGPLSGTFMSTLAGGAKNEMINLNLSSNSVIGVWIASCFIISSQKNIWQNLI